MSDDWERRHETSWRTDRDLKWQRPLAELIGLLIGIGLFVGLVYFLFSGAHP